MPYKRYLVKNGRVNIRGRKMFPYNGSILNLSKETEPETKEETKEVVGGSLGNNEALLRSRLNAVNFLKRQSDDLTRRLTAIEPKKEINQFHNVIWNLGKNENYVKLSIFFSIDNL